jgi:hypothetical protein
MLLGIFLPHRGRETNRFFLHSQQPQLKEDLLIHTTFDLSKFLMDNSYPTQTCPVSNSQSDKKFLSWEDKILDKTSSAHSYW